jgi:prepilin-type N-terminal cleavage/methylation domain-containing protein
VKAYLQNRITGMRRSREFPLRLLPAGLQGDRNARVGSCTAFTLFELLIVVSIIGILAAISLPALKGFGESNVMAAANRHMLDAVAQARQLAISHRSTVYMVFIPPNTQATPVAQFQASNPDFQKRSKEQQLANRLAAGQYTTYALFSERNVGDQPGRGRPRYLTEWKSLPDGVMIAPSKFIPNLTTNGVLGFDYKRFPYPLADSTTVLTMPYIAFDYQGRLILPSRQDNDAVVPLARGSILYSRDANGKVNNLDVAEIPPGNSIVNSNHIRIDWLTGRARIERLEIQ